MTAPRRLAVVFAGACVLVSTGAAPAEAHTVTGVQATNYKSEVVAVSPPLAGIRVRLRDLGNRVELRNTRQDDVVVLGYQGEPYLRVGPSGVYENKRSPAVYLNRATTVSTTNTTLPRQADASAPPEWHRVSGGPE